MALNTKISNLAARVMCDALVDKCDQGSGPGIVRIYSGSQPADVDTAVGAQILLAELTLGDPAFGAAADANPGATATANSVTGDTSANNSGTAAWFRVFDSDGVALWDGSVGTSGCDMTVASTSFIAGAAVNITAWTVTMPES